MAYEPALALIPARGGSKGIPNKNLKEVGGLPLVLRTIDAALNSTRINRVVVTTDDPKIQEISLERGAEVINRPKEIANDTSSSEDALLHALNILELGGELPKKIAFLQCTSPFTTSQEIDQVLAVLDDPYFNSSLSVKPWHGFLWRIDGAGINHDPTLPRQRRQDIEESYLENGAIYAMRTSHFRATGQRFCQPCLPVAVKDMGPEIDTPADLELCRLIEGSKIK